MAYTTHSVTAAAPASAYLALLDVDILAVTGWTKVNALLVVGSRTWNVYKSAAANNSLGQDFYVAIGYITGASANALLMTVFEQWNSTTHLALNFSPTNAPTPTATFANPAAATALPSTGTTMAVLQQTPGLATSGVTAGNSVTPDRIIIWMKSSTNQYGHYLGLIDSLQTTTADPFPLVALHLGNQASNSGSGNQAVGATVIPGFATREPNQSGVGNTAYWGVGAGGFGSNAWTNSGSSSPEGYSGLPWLCRVLLQGLQPGYLRGLLKDCYLGPTQANNGDTFTWTLNSVAHTAVRAGGSSYGVYFDQV